MPLETVSVTGVEIMATGTWNGDEYSEQDLDDLVSAYAAGNAGIDPPVKLGHPSDQSLLNNSGLPAAGYVAALRREGATLLADLRDVPKRIADLINAKAYSKVSAEIYFNLRHGGQRLPRVLKAIALLGADLPAVSSLADIEALYGADLAAIQAAYGLAVGELHVVELAQNDPNVGGGVDRDTLPAGDFAGKGRSYPIVTPKDVADAAASIGRAGEDNYPPEELKRRIIAIATRKGPAFVARLPKAWRERGKENGMNETILTALGLSEGSDEATVLAKIQELAARPATTEGQYSAEEFRTLQNQVGELSAELARRDAHAAVEDAIRAGKVVPAMREWATGYAARDLAGFKTYAEAAPAFPFGATGQQGGSEEPPAITDAERAIAKQLGLSEEKLAESKARALART
jgi:hypothetical protein